MFECYGPEQKTGSLSKISPRNLL